MIEQEVTFKNSKGQTLLGVLRIPDEQGSFPAIIIAHEFMANKDRDLIVAVTNYLSGFSFITLRFDFHGHGESEAEFAETTITQKIDDLKCAVDFVEALPQTDKKRIGLVGHGEGGSIALLSAAKDKRIKAIATIAARTDMPALASSYFSAAELEELRTKGYMISPYGKINRGFLNDLKKHDVLAAVKKIKSPILAVHGTDDKRIDAVAARQIFSQASNPGFGVIEAADHNFSNPEHRQQLLESCLEWFNHCLRGARLLRIRVKGTIPPLW